MLPDTCHAAKAAECAQGDNCAVTASTARPGDGGSVAAADNHGEQLQHQEQQHLVQAVQHDQRGDAS
jgi:hypothetical protein